MLEVLGRHSRVARDALLKVLPINPLPAAEPTPTTTTIYDKSMTHTVVTGQSEKAHTLITMTISTLRRAVFLGLGSNGTGDAEVVLSVFCLF